MDFEERENSPSFFSKRSALVMLVETCMGHPRGALSREMDPVTNRPRVPNLKATRGKGGDGKETKERKRGKGKEMKWDGPERGNKYQHEVASSRMRTDRNGPGPSSARTCAGGRAYCA